MSRTKATLVGVALLAGAVVGDVLSGPTHFFDVFYVVAALLAAWYLGKGWGLAWVVTGGACWVGVRLERSDMPTFWAIWNLCARVGVWCIAVLLLAKVKEQIKAQARNIRDLELALAEIKHLKGLLPVCAWCRKIRDDDGYWLQLEEYVGQHTDATITHGICPECAKKAIDSLRPTPK